MGEPNAKERLSAVDPDEQATLRALNRSPHPYHRQHGEIPSDYDRLAPEAAANGTTTGGKARNGQLSPIRLSAFSKESTPVSDSGTEADDEHFLRGLPAPRTKLHKGLRGRNEVLSGTVTPVSASIIEEEQEPLLGKDGDAAPVPVRGLLSPLRRYRNVVRRITEGGIVALLGAFVTRNEHVAPIYQKWNKGKDTSLANDVWLVLIFRFQTVSRPHQHHCRRIPPTSATVVLPQTKPLAMAPDCHSRQL